MTDSILGVSDQSFQRSNGEKDVPHFPAVRSDGAMWSPVVEKQSRADAEAMFLASMACMDRSGRDHTHRECTKPVLDVMCVPNELAGGADETTHRDWTEIEEGQVEVRIAPAEVGHVHPEDLPRKLFPKGGKSLALGEHLRPEMQQLRRRQGHITSLQSISVARQQNAARGSEAQWRNPASRPAQES